MSEENSERVILVVGSCGLDRLLSVNSYPDADAKVRSTTYNEVGGGNAANTASAIGKMTNAAFVKNRNIRVKFMGKVGDDGVGQNLLDELSQSNVDISSPLCLKGPPGSTTSFTTIIVSEQEHTRTCIHTPGTCGELQVHDIFSADLDEVFRDVVHLHSDSRHTSASLFLAKQARLRGIPISCDCEKDRKNKDLEELVQLADLIFTNSNYLCDYLHCLTAQMEDDHDMMHLPQLQSTSMSSTLTSESTETIVQSLTPSAFLSRWHPRSGREVVVTQGGMGVLHYHSTSHKSEFQGPQQQPVNTIEIMDLNDGKLCLYHRFSQTPLDHRFERPTVQEGEYIVRRAGILHDVNIVDTTGAGDAFVGGYLLAKVALEGSAPPLLDTTQFALNIGTWVAGKKLEGPGARSALPEGQDANEMLGSDIAGAAEMLRNALSSFNAI